MREIKIRVWDTKKKKIIDPILPLGAGSLSLNELLRIYEKSGFILMRYTGFKDKNGILIYEDDIVKTTVSYYSFFSTSLTYIVEYYEGGYIPFADNDDGVPYPDPLESEVIGNIHEHPDKNPHNPSLERRSI